MSVHGGGGGEGEGEGARGGLTCVDVMAAAMHGCSHQRESKQTGEGVRRPPPPPPTVSRLRLVILLR